jgi:hypothetical protein
MIQLLTILVLTLTAVMWLVLELWLVFTKQQPISVFMADGALRFMFVPYGWGVLTGHFFMTTDMQTTPFGARNWWWLGWAILAVAVIVSDIFFSGAVRETMPSWLRIVRTPFLMCMVGIAAGFLFWPQRVPM